MKEMVDLKDSFQILEQDHKVTLEKIDRLDKVLTQLRYEGKIQLGKNVEELEKILLFLKGQFTFHIKKKDTLFSFLEKRIPRLEPLIHMLQAEHKELKVNLEVLEFLYQDLSREKVETRRAQTIEKLKEKGIYLIYLLRHHFQIEEEGIFLAIGKDLHQEEIKEIKKILSEGE